MAKIKNPHDAVIRKSFNDLRVAGDFFSHYLPESIKERINLQTLAIQNGSFIDEKLRASQTDILYCVGQNKSENQPAYLNLLLEAQTTPDKWMPFRLLKYICRILEQHQTQNLKAEYLPLVVPLVFYTGNINYGYSMQIEDLFREPKELVRTSLFGPYPRIDLSKIPDNELANHRWSGYLESVMKYVKLRNTAPPVQTLIYFINHFYQEPHADKYMLAVLEYLINQADTVDYKAYFSELRNHLSSEAEDKVMTTIADRLINEGREQGWVQGKQEGIEEGRVKERQEITTMIACRMYKNGLPSDMILQMTGLSNEELRELLATFSISA